MLKTTPKKNSVDLDHDLFYWIGSESSQDERGVVAYKACARKRVGRRLWAIERPNAIFLRFQHDFGANIAVKTMVKRWDSRVQNGAPQKRSV